MLKVTLIKNNDLIELPAVQAGQSASITDDTGKNESVIILTCKADDSGAVIHRSFSDKYINIGNLRALFDENVKLIAELAVGESYEMPVTKRFGSMIMRFEHVATEAKTTH